MHQRARCSGFTSHPPLNQHAAMGVSEVGAALPICCRVAVDHEHVQEVLWCFEGPDDGKLNPPVQKDASMWMRRDSIVNPAAFAVAFKAQRSISPAAVRHLRGGHEAPPASRGSAPITACACAHRTAPRCHRSGHESEGISQTAPAEHLCRRKIPPLPAWKGRRSARPTERTGTCTEKRLLRIQFGYPYPSTV